MTAPRPAIEALAQLCWEALQAAATDGRHPWHTPALVNATDQGPAARTVVLRAAHREDRTLLCHTDARSPKAKALARDPRVGWLFYDPEQRLQLRADGLAQLEATGAEADRHWSRLRDASQALYAQAGVPGDTLQVGENTAMRREHFVLLRSTITRLDWLQLNDDTHWRARLDWTGARWEAAWVNP